MRSSEIDSLFQRAKQGDKDAYWTLYQEFVRRANIIINATIKATPKFTGFPEDFCDMIDELFFKTIKEYNFRYGPFSKYLNKALQWRLVTLIRKYIAETQIYRVDIAYDDIDAESIEQLADPNQSNMPTELAFDNFKAKIASPNRHKTLEQRQKDKILLLQYAGYSYKEICKYLKIPYSSLRRIVEDMRTDKDIMSIKLDLK